MKILFTGAAGFFAGYAIEELRKAGHSAGGIDNFSKGGPVEKSSSNHPNYRFIEGDAKDAGLLKEVVADCDILVANAAMIGGISYFHRLAYVLMAGKKRTYATPLPAATLAH